MHVLQHENGGRVLPEFFDQDGGDSIRDRARPNKLVQLPARGICDVDERPERARCEERITGTNEKSRASPALPAEAIDERCLPDPGLASDEYDAAASRPGLGECLAELVERSLALEQGERLGLRSSRHAHGTVWSQPAV
jgi:hypothetical protein